MLFVPTVAGFSHWSLAPHFAVAFAGAGKIVRDLDRVLPPSNETPFFVGAAKPAEVCLWKFWWNLIWNSIWNLKFPMGKSGEIWGEDFSTCQESTKKFGANFGANFGENFGNFVSNFATFFGNFFQQKGSAKFLCGSREDPHFLHFLRFCPGWQEFQSAENPSDRLYVDRH